MKVVAALECLRHWEEDCEGSGVAATAVAVLGRGGIAEVVVLPRRESLLCCDGRCVNVGTVRTLQ